MEYEFVHRVKEPEVAETEEAPFVQEVFGEVKAYRRNLDYMW